jgi:hypothetical protein
MTGVTNIRIVMDKGRYKLEAYYSDKMTTPSFETVLMLISYYVKLSGEIYEKTPTKRAKDIARTNHLYLTKPVYEKVCSLQHLCRRTIHSNLKSGNLFRLPIPEKTKIYLSRYPFPV